MPIVFDDPANRRTYAQRTAGDELAAVIGDLVDPTGCDVARDPWTLWIGRAATA